MKDLTPPSPAVSVAECDYQKLLTAYRETRYTYRLNHCEASITIDQHHPQLDALLHQYHITSWCYITAENPLSQKTTASENAIRNSFLRLCLRQNQWLYLKGEGRDMHHQWPAEHSYLVLGIDYDRAIALGRQFTQHAIVFGYYKAPARLIRCSIEI